MRDAEQMNMPLCATVMSVMDVDKKAAQYMIRSARDQGLISFGRHRAVVATIRRERPREFAWTVCEYCLTRWPCGSWIRKLNALNSRKDDDDDPAE